MTTSIQPGDLVVLTREGCNRSANELMAIWTVKNVRDDSVMVEIATTSQRWDIPIPTSCHRCEVSLWAITSSSTFLNPTEFR